MCRHRKKKHWLGLRQPEERLEELKAPELMVLAQRKSAALRLDPLLLRGQIFRGVEVHLDEDLVAVPLLC